MTDQNSPQVTITSEPDVAEGGELPGPVVDLPPDDDGQPDPPADPAEGAP